MYYLRDTKNDSPYESVNTLIKPQKSSASPTDKGLDPNQRILGAGALEVSKPGEPAEQEADRIADQLTAPQPTGYRSPALQMRSEIRTSPLLNRFGPVIQRRSTVETDYGDWDAEKYELTKDKDGYGNDKSSDQEWRGMDVKITFKPNDKVDAELIGLIQTAKSVQNGAPIYLGDKDKTVEKRSLKKSTDAKTEDREEGVHIDREPEALSPIYADDVESKDLQDRNPDSRLGQHGYRYIYSEQLKEQDAILYDKPTCWGCAKKSTQIFETTALATKSDSQQGAYYGSVRWGWYTDEKGKHATLPFIEGSKSGLSSTFKKAAKLWNESKPFNGNKDSSDQSADEKIVPLPLE